MRGLGEGHFDRDQVFSRFHRQDGMSGITGGLCSLSPGPKYGVGVQDWGTAVLTEALCPIEDFIVVGPGPHHHQVSSFTE